LLALAGLCHRPRLSGIPDTKCHLCARRIGCRACWLRLNNFALCCYDDRDQTLSFRRAQPHRSTRSPNHHELRSPPLHVSVRCPANELTRWRSMKLAEACEGLAVSLLRS
jgi:hypothetical protein